jgi:signal transduction histidine kinase/CheY-like chemotaxis protein
MYRCKIDLYGNQVYLGWSPATPAWSESDYGRANIALIVGSIITVLVMLVGISVSRTRSKAVRLAYNMTLSLRESERQQRELASRAEQANLAKSEFLANMSHEIRTPMTAILGYTDILSASDRNPADTESLRVIRRAGEHLLTIINDVLDLTRIEAGRFEIEMATVEVAVLIEDVISGFHGLAADRGIELRLVLTSQIPSLVHTDNIRIRQILIHLIGNAIKFTEDGSVTLEVNFETDHLRLRVIDTGIGIGSEDIERIFSPFEQADNSASRHHNGTGLGLAISRKLAKMLDGELIAESEPGKGSVFTLTVRAPAEPDAAWMRVLGERAASPKPATSTMSLQGRVLLAEDGIDNQRLISYFLCNAGLDVDVVSNGREALDRLHEDQNYDIFITDMQMPVMDGYTTTMCLREMGNTIPILALTAHAMAGDRERCLAVGCNDYEPKPIDRESLIETVRRLLHNRAAHAERADAA